MAKPTLKPATHPILVVNFDEFASFKETPKTVQGHLKHALKEIRRRHHNCQSCGGIIPEIKFILEGVTYSFTCYRIKEDGKVSARTDYGLLSCFHKK